MESTNLTRKQLYDLVWSEPVTSITKRFGISDASLRAICKEHQIPLPKNGYWMKLKYGKPVEILQFEEIIDDSTSINIVATETFIPIQEEVITPKQALKRQVESACSDLLQIDDELRKPDPLIVTARQILNQKREYGDPNFASTSMGALSIQVARENVPRALRIFDSVLKSLRRRGHSFTNDGDWVNALVFGQVVHLRLRETTTRVRNTTDKYRSFDYQLTGKLCFAVADSISRKELIDGVRLLEDRVADIVVEIELYAQDRRDWLEKCRLAEAERQEKRRREYERQKEQELELDKFKTLLNQARRFHESLLISNYIHAVETRLDLTSASGASQEMGEWLRWAKNKNLWYDPTSEATDPILEGIDRNVLELPKQQLW